MNFFNLNGLGTGGSSGISPYKPYINYRWSSTYQANNQMYSKNSGTGTDLQLYSGQGVKFNGVDQGIEIGTSTDWHLFRNSDYTVIFNKDSELNSYLLWLGSVDIRLTSDRIRVWDGTSREIIYGNGQAIIALTYNHSRSLYSIYSNNVLIGTLMTSALISNSGFSLGVRPGVGYGVGILKDLFIFNRALTQTEITKYSTNPNGFFNDALADDACVLNMPLAEHSDYCIDYANYSEGVDLWINPTVLGEWTDNGDGSYTSSANVSDLKIPWADLPDMANGDKLVVRFNLTGADGTTCLQVYSQTSAPSISASVDKFYEVIVTKDSIYNLYRNTIGKVVTVSGIEWRKLSGIHQIQNYTNSCRDEAKQLPYGSQNANYKINGLGMREEESPYFECSELFDNYGDTGFNAPHDEDWTIEYVQYVGILDGDSHYIGYYEASGSNRFYLGDQENNNNIYTRLGASSGSIASTQGYHLITAMYSSATKILTVCVDGVAEKTYTDSNYEGCDGTIYLGTINNLPTNLQVKPIRLFKVHQKVLTQEEVTTAYTDAVNKGLLS